MGTAYLPDGSSMDYAEYIESSPRWKSVRKQRFDADSGQCAFCHKDLHGESFETHHMFYDRLGHEHLRDVITLCPACHARFHGTWRKQDFMRGRERGHWEAYDLDHTAALCAAYYTEDKFISRDPEGPNLCNEDVQKQYIDRYFRENELVLGVPIDPNDIGLFVRNKRYELFFDAERRGLNMEQFLDEYYGPKVRGKNPIRQEAGEKFKHDPIKMHRQYKANKNLNLLMKETQKIWRNKT